MQNREYQLEQTDSVISELSTRRKVLMQLPTGGGKTVEFSMIAQRYIRNTEKSVLILVHRQELMYQAAKTIREMLGIEPYLITSETKRFYISRIYIGMVDSTVSRLNMIHNVGLVIIDECHVANFNKVHSIFLEELIIGVTATPKSASLKDPLNRYYYSIVTGPQISELIRLGFLAQNITRCPKDIVDVLQFEIDKLKGDYNERQMATEYKLPKHVSNVIKKYNKFCKGTKTIVFNVNIEHSKEVTECFQMCGYNCKHLDATVGDDEREKILKWFKETEDAILCNVMIATVGFDEPTIRNVILNFATLSIVKFIQCCGRGGRRIDDAWLSKHQKDYPYTEREKSTFNIIDLGANWVRFGDWSDDRDWQYIFNHPARPGEGVAPVKTCPSCEGLLHAAKRVCDLKLPSGDLCLHEFERKPEAVEQDIEEMIMVTKGINVEELIGKNKRKYQYYTFVEMGIPVVEDMFKKAGLDCSETIRNRYFKSYYEKCIEWYSKTLGKVEGNIEDITDSGFHIKMALNNFNKLIEKYNKKYELDVQSLEPKKMYSFEEDERFKEAVENHPGLINFIPSEYKEDLDIKSGDKVEHKNLGIGKVINIENIWKEKIAVVKFDNYEDEKKIILKYAKLRIAQ